MSASARVGTVETGPGLGPDPSIWGLDLLVWTEAKGVMLECNGAIVEDACPDLASVVTEAKATAGRLGVTPAHVIQAALYAVKAGWL